MIPIMILALVLGLLLGFPIFLALLLPATLPGVINPSFAGNTSTLIRAILGGADNTPLLAIPLFMLSGAIMSEGGISKKLFNVFALMAGKKTAGMPIAVIITCTFYGAICGSGPATTAAVGAMAIPILISLGYDKVFAATLCAAAGGIGIIIPPSIPFIMYGTLTSTSEGDLFTAGFIPGILIAVCLSVYVYFYCKYKGEDKLRIEANYENLKKNGVWSVIKDSFWALLTPVIILGGIYSGVVTPTEAATLSVFYALVICLFVYRTIKIKDIPRLLETAIRQYAFVAYLVAIGIALLRILTLLKVPAMVADFFTNNNFTSFTFLMLLNLLLLIVGMFMDIGPAITLLAPMLVGVIKGFNIDPVHFGVLISVNLCIGFISPPFGLNLFTAAPLIKSSPALIGKKALPFIAAYLVALGLITYIHDISMFLVRVLG